MMGVNQATYKIDLTMSQIEFMRRWSASPAQMQAFTTCAIVWDEAGRVDVITGSYFKDAIEAQFGQHGMRSITWMKSQDIIGIRKKAGYGGVKIYHAILDHFEEWATAILADKGPRWRVLNIQTKDEKAILRSSYRVERVSRPAVNGDIDRTDYYVKSKDWNDIVSGKWLRDRSDICDSDIIDKLVERGADDLLLFKAQIYAGKTMPEWLKYDVRQFLNSGL